MARPTRQRKGDCSIDFDGSTLVVPKKYKTLKAQEELRRLARMGDCPHPAVQITIRCSICGTYEIHTVQFFPKKGVKLVLGVAKLHNHPI